MQHDAMARLRILWAECTGLTKDNQHAFQEFLERMEFLITYPAGETAEVTSPRLVQMAKEYQGLPPAQRGKLLGLPAHVVALAEKVVNDFIQWREKGELD